MNTSKLTPEAKWELLKYLGAIVFGSWTILGIGTYKLVSFAKESAEREIALSVRDEIDYEMTQFKELRTEVSQDARSVLEARISVDNILKNIQETKTVFDQLHRDTEQAKESIRIIRELSSENDTLVRKIASSTVLQNSVSNMLSAIPIGTVIPSLLTPEEMSMEYGEDWVLADRRPVPRDSTYYEITKKDLLSNWTS